MKPERIQDRLQEKPEWTTAPAAIERRWPCEGFLQAAGLARVVHTTLVDSLVHKIVTTSDHEVAVWLSLETPLVAGTLLDTRDRLDAAVAAAGF